MMPGGSQNATIKKCKKVLLFERNLGPHFLAILHLQCLHLIAKKNTFENRIVHYFAHIYALRTLSSGKRQIRSGSILDLHGRRSKRDNREEDKKVKSWKNK